MSLPATPTIPQNKEKYLQEMLNGAKHYAQKAGAVYEPEKDPKAVSIFNAVSTIMAGEVQDVISLVGEALKPISQKDIYGITQGLPQNAVGTLVFEKTTEDNVFIPQDTILETNDGIPYKVLVGTSDVISSVLILNITADGNGKCVVQTFGDAFHYLVSSFTISITGASDPDFNVEDVLVGEILSQSSFTYTKQGLPAGTSSGGNVVMNVMPLEVQGAVVNLGQLNAVNGEETNQQPYTPIQFQTPISGINEGGFVWFGGLSGGADFQTEESLAQEIQSIARDGTLLIGGSEYYENMVNGIDFVLESRAFEETEVIEQVLTNVVRIVFLKRDRTDIIQQDIDNVNSQIKKPLAFPPIVITAPIKLFYQVEVDLTTAGFNSAEIVNVVQTTIESIFANANLGLIIYKAQIVNQIYNALKIQRSELSESALNKIINNITVKRKQNDIFVENPDDPERPIECISVIDEDEIIII